VKPVLALIEQMRVKGLAHITGGGLLENIPRILPDNATAQLQRSAWPRPPLFDWLQNAGGVAEQEMLRVFNCGIGMAIVVGQAQADAAVQALGAAGETVFRIGRIRAREPGEAQTVVS